MQNIFNNLIDILGFYYTAVSDLQSPLFRICNPKPYNQRNVQDYKSPTA